MNTAVIILATLATQFVPAVEGQEPPAKDVVPIYSVTVVERGVDAVIYQYRSAPTKIDFRGTVLLSTAKGQAIVESRQGRAEIDAKFENLTAPSRFGPGYLTYVLWAISPEGAAHNLGEIIPDASDRAKLRATTSLQAFGLIVTAEPYASVRQPSSVVTLENKIRPDTAGKIEPVKAKEGLLTRPPYTLQIDENSRAAAAGAPKVSMSQYEALLELYQAQNAVSIARAAEAERLAPEAFSNAVKALNEAQRLQQTKANAKLVVQAAREATQTAEDARSIAESRKHAEQSSQLEPPAGSGGGNPSARTAPQALPTQ